MENLDTCIAELRNRAMRLRRVTEAIETSLLPALVSYRDSLGYTPERCATREDTKASLQTKAVRQRPEAMKVKEQPEESMVDGSPAGKDATIPDGDLNVQELSRNILRDRVLPGIEPDNSGGALALLGESAGDDGEEETEDHPKVEQEYDDYIDVPPAS